MADFRQFLTIFKPDALQPACAWFLEMVPVWTSVCVFVCVSAPEAINN